MRFFFLLLLVINVLLLMFYYFRERMNLAARRNVLLIVFQCPVHPAAGIRMSLGKEHQRSVRLDARSSIIHLSLSGYVIK